jgi:hypothetical protein
MNGHYSPKPHYRKVGNLYKRAACSSAEKGEIVYRHEFDDALGRIKYLEKKLGIESGI